MRKNTKKFFFDTPTEKSCHHCGRTSNKPWCKLFVRFAISLISIRSSQSLTTYSGAIMYLYELRNLF